MKHTLDEATRREIAVKASADPRSVEKVLRGEHVRGLAGHRIRAALEAAGITVPTPRRATRGAPRAKAVLL